MSKRLKLNHNQKYSQFILQDKDEKKWSLFVGRCLLIGNIINMPYEHILEYIFETYHGFTLKEIPKTLKDLKMDIILYKNHK